MGQMDSNQGNYTFSGQRFDPFDGAAFSNQIALEESIESLLERRDLAEAEMVLYHLEEDIPVPVVKNEREQLLRNAVQ